MLPVRAVAQLSGAAAGSGIIALLALLSGCRDRATSAPVVGPPFNLEALAARTTRSDGIKVTPPGHLTTLTPEQKEEAIRWIERFHPRIGRALVEQAFVIDPKAGLQTVVNITESHPQGLGDCIVIITVGGRIQDLNINFETKKGDGSFSGPPNIISRLSFGTISMKHGMQSIDDPMRVQVKLNFLPSP